MSKSTPTLSDLLATPDEITYKGRVYKLAPLSIAHRAQFSRWLERRAREDAARAAVDLPDDAATKYMRTVSQDIASGAYDWGGPVSMAALAGMPGMRKMLMLRLQDNHPEVDEEFTEKMIEEILAQKLNALVRAVEENDPKVQAALRTLGLKLDSSAAPS
jgi:hypothetical protein